MIFNTSANVASYILVLKNNTNNAGAFYGVKVDSVAQIGFIRNSDQERTSGTDGGVLQVNAETYVDQLRTSQVSATSIAQKGIDINADCTIASAVIENYDSTVSLTTKKDGNSVIISVKDNGNGIPKKVLDKIFQPFFTTKPTGQGTGLGLSMSYDIITKGHGGELKVITQQNKGTEFIIKLPI